MLYNYSIYVFYNKLTIVSIKSLNKFDYVLDGGWAELVETELRQILSNPTNSTLSESISSVSPPLPPLSPSSDEPQYT